VSLTLHEIADVSAMSNEIADVSAMWCDVAQDCQCVDNVGNVGNVPKTLTLPKDIDIASESQSGVETPTSDKKIEFDPNYEFASAAARLLHPMCVIQPPTNCWKQSSSISLRRVNVLGTSLTLTILRGMA
jgi:hypothetical protein